MRISKNDKDCLELMPECKEDIDQFFRMVMARKLTVVFGEDFKPKALKIHKEPFPLEMENDRSAR